MGLWSRLTGKQQRFLTTTGFGIQTQPVWGDITVTEGSALGLSALWCGICVIAETIGSLPCVVYERQPDDGKLLATKHSNFRLLGRAPNPVDTRPVFFECLMGHAVLYGNAFAEVIRSNSGKPIAIWPIHPTRCQVQRDTQTRELSYRVTELDGTQSIIPAHSILHVPGLTADGSVAYRLLQVARETISFGLATQRYANSLYRNMSQPSGIIQIPAGVSLDDTGRQNLAKAFRANTSLENVGSVPVLEQGITFNPQNLSTNQQLQFKELNQFYVYEIARLLRIPPAKLQSLEKASFASLTEQNREFLNCLNPWLEKWESELEKKLFTDAELDTYYVEFDTDQLVRSDQGARYTAYQSALNAGWMSVNEVRANEGLSNIGPDGDEYGGPAPAPPEPQPYPTVNPLADANPPDPEGNQNDDS